MPHILPLMAEYGNLGCFQVNIYTVTILHVVVSLALEGLSAGCTVITMPLRKAPPYRYGNMPTTRKTVDVDDFVR